MARRIKGLEVHNYGANELAAHTTRIPLKTGADNVNDLYVGMLLVFDTDNTDGYRPIEGTEGTPDDDADYYVQAIYDTDGEQIPPFKHITATELNANTYYADVIPVGGLIFRCEEDTAGEITDANASAQNFVDIIVTDASGRELTQENTNPFGAPKPTIQLDGGTVAASRTSELFQIVGLVDSADQITAAQASADSIPRTFLVKVAAPDESL